jgi:hypothetical protein
MAPHHDQVTILPSSRKNRQSPAVSGALSFLPEIVILTSSHKYGILNLLYLNITNSGLRQ